MPGIPAISSRQNSGIDVNALSEGSSALKRTDPITVGGEDGSPMNGNARVVPIASGRTAASSVVGTNRKPVAAPW